MRALWIVVMSSLGACEAEPPDPIAPGDVRADRVLEIVALQADPASGQAVYLDQCYGCHRPDGIAGLGPSLPAYVALADPIDVVTVVIEGQGRMVPMGSAMPDQAIADLVAHLFDRWKIEPVP